MLETFNVYSIHQKDLVSNHRGGIKPNISTEESVIVNTMNLLGYEVRYTAGPVGLYNSIVFTSRSKMFGPKNFTREAFADLLGWATTLPKDQIYLFLDIRTERTSLNGNGIYYVVRFATVSIDEANRVRRLADEAEILKQYPEIGKVENGRTPSGSTVVNPDGTIIGIQPKLDDPVVGD